MGVTTLAVEIANPAKPEVRQRLEFIVDSGVTQPGVEVISDGLSDPSAAQAEFDRQAAPQ